MIALDSTHDPRLRSWVEGADDHRDFPIQNLPLGVFSPGGGAPRIGVAIGDSILDLTSMLTVGALGGDAATAVETARGGRLNEMLALGAGPRHALRVQVSAALREGSPWQKSLAPFVQEARSCTLHLPSAIGDYTDFYVGIHHAENIGKQFRPDNPLLPNYRHVPIGYHGRASSIVPSGVPVRRPRGQAKPADGNGPVFRSTRRLDYELELGIWTGLGNALGEPIPIAHAAHHIAGYCILNDWSARDVQAWEYQPLGPFLAKNFATTVSPWIITPEALAPFRTAASRPTTDPALLPYLADPGDQREGALDLELEVLLSTPRFASLGLEPQVVARSNTRHMYWTPAQLVAHHTSGGCNLRPGDLLGTGTISGPGRGECGSLVEATLGGREPLKLSTGEERTFLEDGDTVCLRARGCRAGFATIGFGECRAEIIGSHP